MRDRRARDRRGLTLLELLLVVVILAALATAAVAVLDQTDNQARYEATKARAALVRDAVLGPQNPSGALSGFVADHGRLPATLAELTSQSIPNVSTIPSYSNFLALTTSSGAVLKDANNVPYLASVGGGWRGPYLPQDTDPTAELGASFRDGWGNVSPASATATLPAPSPDGVDFGWQLTLPGNSSTNLQAPFTPDGFGSPANNSFVLKSYGSDNTDDSTYASGPPTWDAADVASALGADDYLVRLAGWAPNVQFTGASLAGQNVYLRLYYPSLTVPSPGSPTATLALTYVQSASATVGAAGTVTTFPPGFTYPTSAGFPTNPTTGDVRVPLGLRILAVFKADATGNPTDAPVRAPLFQPGNTSTNWVAQAQVALSPRASLPVAAFTIAVAP